MSFFIGVASRPYTKFVMSMNLIPMTDGNVESRVNGTCITYCFDCIKDKRKVCAEFPFADISQSIDHSNVIFMKRSNSSVGDSSSEVSMSLPVEEDAVGAALMLQALLNLSNNDLSCFNAARI